jgi:hypothetical protein
MTIIHIELPNQTPTGQYRAVAMMDFECLEIAEARTATKAIDMVFEIYPDAQLDEAAKSSVMEEMMMGVAQ